MSEPVLEIKALTRRFGAFTAVDALTLSVNVGEVFVHYAGSALDSGGNFHEVSAERVTAQRLS